MSTATTRRLARPATAPAPAPRAVEPNRLAGLLTPEQRPAAPAPARDPGAPRKRGRPPKPENEQLQSTTLRLDPEDHATLRSLAFRDRTTLNDLIYRALADYCEGRSVRFKGPKQ